MTTLIASLGQSPAVITETLDHLRDKGTNNGEKIIFDRFVIIAPGKLPLVQAIKGDFLKEGKDFSFLSDVNLNKDYPEEIIWSMDIGYLTELEDIKTENDAAVFYKAVMEISQNWCYTDDVYFAIAGGRKSMSALMVLAAQMLPVKGIFHILLNDIRFINSDFARQLRNDEKLIEFFVAYDEFDDEEKEEAEEYIQKAFHPGIDNTTLVQILFWRSYSPEICKEIGKQFHQFGNLHTFSGISKSIFNFAMEVAPERDNSKEMPDFSSSKALGETVTADQKQQVISVLEKLWKENSFIEEAFCTKWVKPIWENCKFAGKGQQPEQLNEKFLWNLYIPITNQLSISYRLHTTATKEKQALYCLHQIKRYFEKRRIELYNEHENKKKVLICSLGESPGVVTTAVHYYETLSDKPITFNKIAVIAPDNADIRNNCLNANSEIRTYMKNRLDVNYFSSNDVRNQKDLELFLEKTQNVIQEYINEGYEIYLNLAGGRKVMSGAMLILAQLYPIKEAFHISILNDELDKNIEDYGDWRGLKQIKDLKNEKYKRILYPEKDDVELIALKIDDTIIEKIY